MRSAFRASSHPAWDPFTGRLVCECGAVSLDSWMHFRHVCFTHEDEPEIACVTLPADQYREYCDRRAAGTLRNA